MLFQNEMHIKRWYTATVLLLYL